MSDQPDLSIVEPPDEVTPLADPDLFPGTVEPEEIEESPEDVLRRARKEETERAVRHRAEIFIELSKTDAFKELRLEFYRMGERAKRTFVEKTLAGTEINQRQVDYDRGWIDGLFAVDKVIAGAERTLKKLDEQSAEQESEPDDSEGRWEF